MTKRAVLEFISAMTGLAATDRDLYRELRAEAWKLVQLNHETKSETQRATWSKNAS